MRTALFIAAVVALTGCSQNDSPIAPPQNATAQAKAKSQPVVADANADATSPDAASKSDADDKTPPTIKPLTADEQQSLLNTRLDGGMGHAFGQFANMFLVSSRIHLGTGVGLMAASKKIAETPLQSPFPPSYKPTLREFLDAIALQTSSQWAYDPSGKFIQSDVKRDQPVEGLAVFEFVEAKREKPHEVNLAEGWTATDKGQWTMYSPPNFPVGMDIYEMGTYSPAENEASAEFAEKIRSAVALQWAQRVNKNAAEADFKSAKVGSIDAIYYESMIPSQLDKEVKWRQWAFVADGKCYFIVSTIFPEFEEQIFPDVEKMLASFRIKPK
jgi:hypothetical protein